jgi:single-strand DNA-binding protein
MNKVFLTGRLGQDPAVRFTQSQTAVCQFSMATSEKFKKKDGTKEEVTHWHQIVAWGKLGEICGQYLTKGSLITIVGKVTYRTYDAKDGTKKFITEIVASEMEMHGGGKQKEQQQQGNAAPPAGEEDDIPF